MEGQTARWQSPVRSGLDRSRERLGFEYADLPPRKANQAWGWHSLLTRWRGQPRGVRFSCFPPTIDFVVELFTREAHSVHRAPHDVMVCKWCATAPVHAIGATRVTHHGDVFTRVPASTRTCQSAILLPARVVGVCARTTHQFVSMPVKLHATHRGGLPARTFSWT